MKNFEEKINTPKLYCRCNSPHIKNLILKLNKKKTNLNANS